MWLIEGFHIKLKVKCYDTYPVWNVWKMIHFYKKKLCIHFSLILSIYRKRVVFKMLVIKKVRIFMISWLPFFYQKLSVYPLWVYTVSLMASVSFLWVAPLQRKGKLNSAFSRNSQITIFKKHCVGGRLGPWIFYYVVNLNTMRTCEW